MTHEPECLCGCGETCYCTECCCKQIRAAYQRGRRDAANDVANMTPYMLITVINEQRAFVSKSEAYGEALGGEQE